MEVSDDLTLWLSGSLYGINGSVPSNVLTTDVTPLNSNPGWTQVKDDAASPVPSSHFMRLKVELP